MKTQILSYSVMAMLLMSASTASAWRIPGFGSHPHVNVPPPQVGVHANTNGDVGVDLPTPEANIGANGVNATVTPNGAYTTITDSNGVSIEADTSGQVYGNVNKKTPGGRTSGRVDANGVNIDTLMDEQGR